MKKLITGIGNALGALLLAGGLTVANPAWAVPVDVEGIFLVDTSGSVSAADYALMTSGLAAAFRDPAVQNTIVSGPQGAIAVSVVQFSDGAAQSIGWTLINSAAAAEAFADVVEVMARAFSGGTSPTAAINFSTPLFTDNGFEGTRLFIDDSSDGSEGNACNFANPVCVPLQNARDAFLTGGPEPRTINGLWIADPPFFGGPGDTIDALQYGLTNVIGGPGAFQLLINDFNQYPAAIAQKVLSEIQPAPEPASLALLGTALIGLVPMLRRRRKTG